MITTLEKGPVTWQGLSFLLYFPRFTDSWGFLARCSELTVDTVKDITNVAEVSKALRTAVAAKLYGWEDIIVPLVAQACIHILPSNPKDFVVDNIRICKVLGAGVSDSVLIRGFALAKDAEGKYW